MILALDDRQTAPPRVINHDNRDTLLALAIALWDGDYSDPANPVIGHVPASYRGLPSGSGWTFDTSSQTYISDTGTKIRGPAIGQLIDTFATSVEIDLEQASSEMLTEYEAATPANRPAILDDWLNYMLSMLAAEYAAAAAVGAGGSSAMTEEDWTTLEGNAAGAMSGMLGGIAEADVRLEDFAQQIADGEAGTTTAIVSRAGSYGAAAFPLYEAVRRNSHIRVEEESPEPGDGSEKPPSSTPGPIKTFTEERSILDPASSAHCHDSDLPGCVEQAALGWQPIGTLVPVGLRTCGTRDRCSTIYRKGKP